MNEAPAKRLDEAREIVAGVMKELGAGGLTDDLYVALIRIEGVSKKLRSYADDDEE